MANDQSLREQFRGNVDSNLIRDILLFFVLPSLILIAIYLYPGSEQALEYEARNPTVVGIIGSNLAHRNISHIQSNIIGYWILGGASLLLMRVSGSAAIYRYAFVAYILILPFFASWTILQIFSDSPDILSRFESVGFSQTVGAVTGFLPIAIAYYYSELTGDTRCIQVSLGLFVLGFAVAFYSLGEVNNTVILLGVLGVAGLLYMSYQLVQSPETLAEPGLPFLGGSVVLYLYGLLLLFPPSAPGGIYGHMAGYVWGYLLPAVGIAVKTGYDELRS
ncbi:hypothetical protein [Halobellus rarus]|uniref:Rhomboid family intramembrane serine protease n=1 Tax=Halobellus rarus TaxID=1126237 RepID=A0ABD6CS81_9EURY|nr:hypothetical protein [Halobellus rarus]